MTTTTLSIATIAGDGTGPEVTAEAIKVLDAVARLDGFEFTVEALDWGGDRYLRTGEIIPEGGLDLLAQLEVFLNAPVGGPKRANLAEAARRWHPRAALI